MSIHWQDLFGELPFEVLERNPWSILTSLDIFLQTLKSNSESWLQNNKGQRDITGTVYIAEDALIEAGATIVGPAYIGRKVQIRQGAYIRGGAYLGDGAIVGHATEVKHAVFLKNSHAPHFNYVGDSVLGVNVNLGAGVKISNFKNNGATITVDNIDTGLRKIGAFIGDNTKIGCNAVTAPGTIIGKNSLVYPLVFVRGVIPENSIVKLRQDQEIITRI